MDFWEQKLFQKFPRDEELPVPEGFLGTGALPEIPED